MGQASETPTPPKGQTDVTLSIRLTLAQRALVADAAKELGWSPTKLIRTATLERAVHILNTRRKTSFDFGRCVEVAATQLFEGPEFHVKRDSDNLENVIALDQLVELMAPKIAAEPTRATFLDKEALEELSEASRLGGVEFWNKVLVSGKARFTNQFDDLEPIDPDVATNRGAQSLSATGGREAIRAAGLAVNDRDLTSASEIREAVPKAQEAALSVKSGCESSSRRTGDFCGMSIARFQNWLYEQNREWCFTDGTLAVLWSVEFPNARCDYAARHHYVASTRTDYNAGRHPRGSLPPNVPSVAYDRSGQPVIRKGGGGLSISS